MAFTDIRRSIYKNSKRIERFVYNLVNYYSVEDFLNEMYSITDDQNSKKPLSF